MKFGKPSEGSIVTQDLCLHPNYEHARLWRPRKVSHRDCSSFVLTNQTRVGEASMIVNE